MKYEESIELLSQAVKESHLENQKHLDLTLICSSKRALYENALMWGRTYIARGDVSEEQFRKDIGLV